MTPQLVAIAGSVVGAALFFGAGYFVSRKGDEGKGDGDVVGGSNQQAEQLRQQLREAQQQYQQLQQRHQQVEKDAKDGASARAEVASLEKELEGLRRDSKTWREQVDSARTRETELAASNAAGEQQRAEFEARVKDLAAKVAKLEKERDDALAQAEELERQLAEQDNEPTQVEKAPVADDGGKKTIMAGSGMMAPSTPVEEPKQDPKKTMMAGSGTMELQRAQAELKRSQAEARKAQAEAKKAAAESKKLAAELKTAEQKHQVAGRRVQQLDKTVETMRKQAENQRGELDALRSQLLKARAEAEELGERLTHKPSTKAGVGSDPAQLLENAQAEAQRLRTALDQSQHELVALRAELEDMQSEEPTKIKKRPVAEGEKALREQLDSVCKERDALKKATETQLQRMRELEKELDAKSGDEITQLKTRVATQADQLEDHQSKAAHWRSEAETLTRQLEDQKALEAEVEELKARLAAADNKLERAERLEVERYELKDQVETLAERIKDLEALEKLADEHASLKLQAESVRRKEDDFERLKDEKATLAEKMMMLEKERDALKQEIDGHKNAQDDRTDLALRINVLEEQLRELEQLREDNLRLKSHREENESLRKEIEQLQEDNANYQSLELIAKAPPKPKITFEESSEDEGMGNTLQRLVEKLSQDISGRATVLADELGLVVAGIGDNADAMAAVSAIFAEINGRIRGVLPLGRLQQLLLVDENQLTYSAQPFKAVGGELILATLTAGLPPTRERFIELLGPQQDK